MNEELWAGPELKVQHALFHYVELVRAIQPPELSHDEIAQMSSGTIIGNNWQPRFYAHFDAFLMIANSVPEVIQCCFGKDTNWRLRDWYRALDPAEKVRREAFQDQFKPARDAFHALPLSSTRNVVVHRTGIAPISLTVTSMFGVMYVGGPTEPLPTSATSPNVGTDMPWMNQSVPVGAPHYADITVAGKPLFDEAREYVIAAGNLVQEARKLCDQIHGSSVLTPPPG